MFVERVRNNWLLIWSSGISIVLFVAVVPYPIHGLIGGADLMHRIHDTVGSVQYLPLWAVPIFAYGVSRKVEYLHLAMMASLAVFVTGVWSETLVASASWMQLVTLVPFATQPRTFPFRLSVSMLPAAIVGWWSSFAFSSSLISLQMHADSANTHALRFHYSGMAAAYIAMALCASVASLQKMGRLSVALIAGSFIFTGVPNLAFSNYESAISNTWSWAFIASGLVALFSLRGYRDQPCK